MAREKLTAKTVEHAGPGMYGDGDGLWFRVVTAERKAWLLRFTRLGKVREMGLGSYPAVSLADARDKAEAARKLLAAGDPIEAREAAREAEAVGQALAH